MVKKKARYIETIYGYKEEIEVYDVNGEKVEVIYYRPAEFPEYYGIQILWEGAVDFDEWYQTEEEYNEIVEKLKEYYPELAEIGAFD